MRVIGADKFTKETKKTPKLLRDLETEPRILKNKPIENFERKQQQQSGQQRLLRAAASVNMAALRASN